MKMIKKISYISDDGLEFESEKECLNHEQKKKKEKTNQILEEIKNLDLKIWKKYHPDYNGENEPTLEQAPSWLSTDVESILTEFPDSEEEVLEMIQKSRYGEEILQKYIKMEEINKAVSVRRDFLTALKSVREGSDLSGILHFGFSKKDIRELAKIHKSGKCRTKIESLLTDCNYHTESGDFHARRYDAYLNIPE